MAEVRHEPTGFPDLREVVSDWKEQRTMVSEGNIFYKIMTGKRTRGRNFMLVGWMLESILFTGGPSMSGI